ncbi:MAG: GGDEF domain-containing protein [[Clostridium] innocuum]
MMSIKATARLEQMTYLDRMTGTKNRNAFMQDVEKMNMELHSNAIPKEEQGCGVIFADVNGLKELNDTAGHDAGDELLMGVAKKIMAEFPSWNVYRTGGDEFVVLCAGIEEAAFMKKAAILKQQLNRASSLENAAVGASWSKDTL